MRALFVTSIVVGGALATGCSPYEPDLGPSPFKCGMDEPRCPDGYMCNEAAAGGPACEKIGGGGNTMVDAPPSGFECANESGIEPNDSTATAFNTPVADSRQDFTLGPVSICTDGDRDYYRINLTQTANVEVSTMWDSGMPVNIALVSMNDTQLAVGTATTEMSLRACAVALPPNVYFAKASAGVGVKNNYRLSIKLVPSC